MEPALHASPGGPAPCGPHPRHHFSASAPAGPRPACTLARCAAVLLGSVTLHQHVWPTGPPVHTSPFCLRCGPRTSRPLSPEGLGRFRAGHTGPGSHAPPSPPEPGPVMCQVGWDWTPYGRAGRGAVGVSVHRALPAPVLCRHQCTTHHHTHTPKDTHPPVHAPVYIVVQLPPPRINVLGLGLNVS